MDVPSGTDVLLDGDDATACAVYQLGQVAAVAG
jgi:hypothetical protein